MLSLSEAPDHPHNEARQAFIDVGGVVQPAPAPRFERTPGGVRDAGATSTGLQVDILDRWGLAEADIDKFL